jgi:hypothetical protein
VSASLYSPVEHAELRCWRQEAGGGRKRKTHAFMSCKCQQIIGPLILLFEQPLGRTALNRTPSQVSTVAPAYTPRAKALS